MFTLTICNCFYQRSMKKSPIFMTDIKSSHNSILFHKVFRSITANSTARSLSKDNLLYHNLSESKYLWPYLTKSENLKFFPFYICQNQPPKNVERSFFTFFKRISFHCQTFLDLKSLWKCRKLWVLLIFVMKTGGFLIRSLAKVVRKSSKWKNKKNKKLEFFGPVKSCKKN